jgi:hypothetical protein
VDVVCDPVGGGYSELASRSIAWCGRFLVIGFRLTYSSSRGVRSWACFGTNTFAGSPISTKPICRGWRSPTGSQRGFSCWSVSCIRSDRRGSTDAVRATSSVPVINVAPCGSRRPGARFRR